MAVSRERRAGAEVAPCPGPAQVFNQIVGQKALSKENMKKVTTIMEAASKLFAGELVERARIVGAWSGPHRPRVPLRGASQPSLYRLLASPCSAASEMGYEGPLLPEHLRQAHHELVGEGKIPCRDLKRRRMFR